MINLSLIASRIAREEGFNHLADSYLENSKERLHEHMFWWRERRREW